MKPIYSIILSAFILVCASTGLAQTSMDSCQCNCPPPVEEPDGLGPLRPVYADILQKISPNNHWLAFQDGGGGDAYLLNLATLRQIDLGTIDTHITGGRVSGMYTPVFCPYDTDLIALAAYLYIDTVPNGDAFFGGNIYTYRISTGVSELITPTIFGAYGPGSAFELFSWQSGSTVGNDTLDIGWLYIPELDTLWLPPQSDSIIYTFAITRDNLHSVYLLSGAPLTNIVGGYFFDTVRLPFNSGSVDNASFSPDGKLMAVSGTLNDTTFDQVFIYDVATHSLVKTINFQNSFCTYNLWGAYAEFLTDSTLAVSMHKDSAESSPLWEITIDGRIVRQLTILPEWPTAGVANADIPSSSIYLTSYPNPFSQSTTIAFSSPESGEAEVTIVNLLGTPVALLFSGTLSAGEHSFEWDAGQASAGTYFCALRTSAGVQRVALVVDR